MQVPRICDVFLCCSLQFVRDDLKHEGGLSKRNFHSNDDFITVHDLWRLWVTSEGQFMISVISISLV